MSRYYILALLCVLTSTPIPLQATVIDSINSSAQLASNATDAVDYSFPGNDIGWYYTPSFSYELTGIATVFGATNVGVPHTTPTITLQFQTDRPTNGGLLLEQGQFQVDSLSGGAFGISFVASPLLLNAGQAYFVDLTGINGVGLNLGLWADNASNNPQPSNGATTSLLGLGLGVPAYYTDPAGVTGFPFQSVNTDAYATVTFTSGFGTVNVGAAEPVLNFSGYLVPEPSSWTLLAWSAMFGLGTAGRRLLGRGQTRRL